jgi:phenylacetate-CoA ligase
MLPDDRFPFIDRSGFSRLQALLEHPSAPRFTHPGVDRLSPQGLARARAYADAVQSAPPRWKPGEHPAWLAGAVAHCFREVPFYRRCGPPPQNFFDLPTVTRADLQREPWSFVPDSQPLDDLIIYNTSGTTGHPLSILTHGDSLALYIPLLQAALGLYGVALEGGPGRVSIVLACHQRRTYTYAAVSAVLGQAGFVKVNLNPDDWREAGDRAAYLDDCNPEIYTGDPIAFAELARLPLRSRPKALVSTAMTLTAGLRRSLEDRFGCPVLDLYSMNESGPIGVGSDLSGLRHRLLQPHLFVEILDKDGHPCPRGEVTLSGGFNPFLPLIRYRTGDTAGLVFEGDTPALVGLEGRPPVVFRAFDGRPINNVDVSNALRPLPIVQFHLHQFADGSLRLGLRGEHVDAEDVRARLLDLFGAGQRLAVEDLPAGDKMVQYTRDL